MKQFRHHTYFRGNRSQITYTDKHTAHVGVRIDGKMQEVYRVELTNVVPTDGTPAFDEIHVSDMIDEGHFFVPTVERKRSRLPRLTLEALARKYERLAREQVGV